MKKIVIGLVFVLLIVGLSGCVQQNENKEYTSMFIGNWKRSDGKPLKIYENGSYYTDTIIDYKIIKFWGNWSITDDILILNYQKENLSYTFEFVNDDEFIVTDIQSGITNTYSRN
jgi:hypothetical protein